MKNSPVDREPWVINPAKKPADGTPELPTNLVTVRVASPAEVQELQKPKYPIHTSGALVEQLHDRVVYNRSTRTPVGVTRTKWMLKVLRPFRCEFLNRMIEPGETIECHDSADHQALTMARGSRGTDKDGKQLPDYGPDAGPFCEVTEAFHL